ncbi:hypothetical protein CC1G_01494 [Coprinopsis cinerea okayama7|uniref:Uncharacterized protein n=1 Tax=Coprinopsis cinerea (strain Okayama-7 / 130 / ATCC MYA-4618 / FGSC 9003) TaxID=240176 RepID=A8NHS6_COPC7|nr:hypothetical protein CC1G_01494 [Coprinopsis cinerea okayama7\|eukprot:XP_001833817.1 hypothetical protein CC1G_01494 [Coprinopsis cinerea okayama7\
MAAKYERLPTSDRSARSRSSSPLSSTYTLTNEDADVEYDAPLSPRNRETRECIRAFHADPRFHQPTPSPWARAALLFTLFFLFWLAWKMRLAIFVDFGLGSDAQTTEQVDLSY